MYRPHYKSINIKKAFLLLCHCVFILAFSSCDSEDDISSIFVGRTWYVSGGDINGVQISGDDLKGIYSSSSAYMLFFASDYSFSGTLVEGSSVAGTWKADGKKNSLSLNFTKSDNVNGSSLSANIYNILKSATSYDGDENNIKIKEDNKNFIRFTKSRNSSN